MRKLLPFAALMIIGCSSCTPQQSQSDASKGVAPKAANLETAANTGSTPDASRPGVSSVSNTPVSLQGYVVPAVPGWEGESFVRPGSVTGSVFYRKEVEGNKAKVGLIVYFTSSGQNTPTLKSLKNMTRADLKSQKRNNPPVTLLESSETSYRGFPAVLQRTKLTPKKGGSAQLKNLRIADGKNTLIFTLSLQGDKISTEAQKEAEAVWQTLIEGLTIPR